MAQYSVQLFKWSGTGYNAQYNTSYDAIIDDDDAVYNGSSDANETVSIDGGPFGTTSGPGYKIDVSFTDTDGNSHVETFNFINTGGAWYFAPQPDSEFTEGATLGSYQGHTSSGWSYSSVTCFVRGTLIETEHGPVRVENLRTGTKVLTAEGDYAPLRLSMSRKVSLEDTQRNPKLVPVRIMAGALGNGLPKRDLLVSRQHRMLVSSKICERMFGEREALVAAIKLAELPGVYPEPDHGDVEYFHLLFDDHKIIIAEGAPSESFFTGPEALKAMNDKAREEILTILPQITETDFLPEPARHIPTEKLQKKLIERHVKNGRHLLCSP
ncbi:Hint domain-containing protein [Roseobacteraceae bacterium S113]